MKTYSLYSNDLVTPEKEAMLTRFSGAVYGKFILFPTSHVKQFGIEPTQSDDLSGIVITDDPQQPNEMTEAQFTDWAMAEFAKEHTGREVIINRQCALILYKNPLFNPVSDEGEV